MSCIVVFCLLLGSTGSVVALYGVSYVTYSCRLPLVGVYRLCSSALRALLCHV
ncbi:hypothetical protein GDO78_014272 [Eleutherodactylus coqui]|uniref:NADH dehydrogenase subunit 6 n=1 Tax=Eleutherodactylus coqui TaxID=57060 RepID=A0A8J6EF06_ELECQ|nr:hypothetical protein GDO78_014272 [Eleutherodactylus coqui]KAG9467804.1 hypothetical protein GDO78_014272 [Eleutherodactylus coqui]